MVAVEQAHRNDRQMNNSKCDNNEKGQYSVVQVCLKVKEIIADQNVKARVADKLLDWMSGLRIRVIVRT